MFNIGRFYILYKVTSLNCFLVAPREDHLKRLIYIFGYLQPTTVRYKGIVVYLEYKMEIISNVFSAIYWLDNYPTGMEDIDEGLLKLFRRPLITMLYFDYDHAHDQVARQYVSGVMCFVGSTTVSWSRNREGDIKTSSYYTELCTYPVAM